MTNQDISRISDLHDQIKTLTRRAEAAEKALAETQSQAAAMRQVLEDYTEHEKCDQISQGLTCPEQEVPKDDWCFYCDATAALKSDAGRDYVPMSDVTPFIDACSMVLTMMPPVEIPEATYGAVFKAMYVWNEKHPAKGKE